MTPSPSIQQVLQLQSMMPLLILHLAYQLGGPKFLASDTLKFVNSQQFSQAVKRLWPVPKEEAPRRQHEANLFESNYSKCPKYLGFKNKLYATATPHDKSVFSPGHRFVRCF